jgi:lipocalin
MFKFLVVAVFALASAQNIPIFPGQCRTPEQFGGVHVNFDLNRYLGLWFEIER